jgi:hypothetical protein
VQDEQQIEQPAAETPAETTAPIPAPGGKKGGKPPGQPNDSKVQDDKLAVLIKRFDRIDSHDAAIEKQVKQVSVTTVSVERSLDSKLGPVADDVNAMRTLVLDIDKRLNTLVAERTKADARILDAVSKYEASVQKSLEAAVASCEALTGISPQNARLVRQVIGELKARTAPATFAQRAEAAPTRPWWHGWWAVFAVAGAVVVALLALLA